MRIVITKNGTKIIEDLSPKATINFNSSTNSNNLKSINKIKLRNFQKNKSVNHLNVKNKIDNFNTQIESNSTNNNKKNIDINDMLNNIKNNRILKNIDTKMNTLEIIKLKDKQKLKFPKIFENKYLLYDSNNKIKSRNSIIPDILLTINDSINSEISNRNRNTMKRAKTLADLGLNNLINDINISENKKDITLNNNNYNNKISLPKIRESFPIKYIINKDSINRLSKEMDKLEKNSIIENKLFTNNNNYFIKNIFEKSKKNFDLSLKNEINSKNVNLIEYLNKNKNISNIFLQQFSNFNNEKIDKLESISKKILFQQKQEEQMNNNIKNKIKTNLINIDKQFKKSLNKINNKLNKYEVIIKKDENKFILNNKNIYLDKFLDVKKNWEKYNLERYFKKSQSPTRSIFRPTLE